jgi:hypothetical protein
MVVRKVAALYGGETENLWALIESRKRWQIGEVLELKLTGLVMKRESRMLF